MPWKEHDVTQERFRFIEQWNSQAWSMAELCRWFGVTRKTGYKWVERYQGAGLDGLRDLSRAALQHPNATGAETESRIVELRGEHPHWGARKIRACLLRQLPHYTVPAHSTIGAILKANGLTVVPKRRRKARPSEQPLAHATAANTVWCADFKGWFRTRDQERIDPLTITDAYSRYLLRCQAVLAADTTHSQPVFEAAFREFGLPQRIRTDNGAPFASNSESGLSRLSVWWIKLGIQPERIRPGQPQQNGRHERMHRTLKQATAHPPAANRRAQQRRFDAFRREYNEDRPHQALDQATPGSLYQPSRREHPLRLAPVEYPETWQVRKVAGGGQIRWHGEMIFLAHALAYEPVGLEQVEERVWRVWFCDYQVGVLDEASRLRRPDRWKRREP